MGQSSPRKTTRREFTRTALLAALAAPAAACAPAVAPAPPSMPVPDPIPDGPAPDPTADALFAIAEARYGRYLTPDQQAAVRRSIDSYLSAAERLRAAPLTPADEPSFVFRVIREEA